MRKTTSLYSKDFTIASEILRDLILRREPIFLLAQVSKLMAKASYLQNTLANEKYFDTETQTRSFFGNSHFEAIACAVKIARHKARDSFKKEQGHVCIYDPTGVLEKFYNPFHATEDRSLTPGLSYFKDLASLQKTIKEEEVSGVLILDHKDINVNELKKCRLLCREKNVIFILDEFKIDFDTLTSVDYKKMINPDVILLSENIVKGQVPYGATIMTEDTYQPWNSMENMIIHSNTFGANRLSLEILIQVLQKTEWFDLLKADINPVLGGIDSDHALKMEYLMKYYNPNLTAVLSYLTLDRSVKYAYGSTIQFVNPDKSCVNVIDALANFGVNIRGYSPTDIIEEVLNVHDSETDYFQMLSDKLKEITGLAAVFPAVSGASAVGLAMRLAFLYNPKKTKAIVFRGGYAGKTLVSILGTAKEKYKKPFGPFYPGVIEIDLFADTAVEDFKNAIKNHDVALVWMELIQGEAGIRIFPEKLLSVVKNSKDEAGYLIGVDEIQTGIFRTGTFLNLEKRNVKPDIVTLAKAMSDMVYPMGAVLATDEVYTQAKQAFPESISDYEQIYLNQLGAHIALHAITKAIEWDVGKNAAERGQQLLSGLQEAAKPHSFVKEVRGDGLLIGLEFNPDSLPDAYKDMVGAKYAELSLLDEAPVLVYLASNNSLVTRFEPPLIITQEQVDMIIANARRTLKKLEQLFLDPT